MTEFERLADLYGPPAPYSEYRIDERVTWRERGEEKHGVVIYITTATVTRPLIYVVSPDVETFPVELEAHEIVG